MRWTFRKNNEDVNTIEIGYSYGSDETCDGVIIYEKDTEDVFVKKHSYSCDEFESKRAFQFIYGLIEDKKLTSKKYILCTG